MSYVPRLHLVRFPAAISHITDSFLVDIVFYIVGIARDFIQKAVDDFIDAHQHLYSVAHLNPRRFEFGEELKIHRNVKDFERFLDELRVQADHHVCFLSGCPDNVAQMCVGGRVAVIHLPELGGRHHRDILSRGLTNELTSLGLCVGAALHEIGHLFGAFHSVQGIMGEHSSGLRCVVYPSPLRDIIGQCRAMPDKNLTPFLEQIFRFPDSPKPRTIYDSADRRKWEGLTPFGTTLCMSNPSITLIRKSLQLPMILWTEVYASLLNGTSSDSLATSPSCFFDSFTVCIFVHGPFFNHSSADAPSVVYKISEDSVQVRCKDGLLLIVVVKGTNYCDLKLYDELVTSVTLPVSEDSWDFIQIYDIFHHVVNIRSQIKQ